MRISAIRFFPVVLALAVSGCGGCVNPSEGNGAGAGGNTSGGSTPPAQASATGGGKMIGRVTTTPAAIRLLETATVKDGG